MMSSNGNIFRVAGHLCGEFTGHRWIPRTKASDAELWIYGWANNREAGDLRRYRAHYDVTVMPWGQPPDLTHRNPNNVQVMLLTTNTSFEATFFFITKSYRVRISLNYIHIMSFFLWKLLPVTVEHSFSWVFLSKIDFVNDIKNYEYIIKADI